MHRGGIGLPDSHDEPSSAPGSPSDGSRPQDDAATFKKNLIRVMAVQVVTLVLLGYLQYLFTP